VNDTTNNTLLTGREVAGGREPKQRGTTCHMHAQELVVTHALGLRERSKQGIVTDKFEAGKNSSKWNQKFIIKDNGQESKRLL
jgi:hypothetical protein